MSVLLQQFHQNFHSRDESGIAVNPLMQSVHEKRNMVWYLFTTLFVSAQIQQLNSKEIYTHVSFHFYYLINGVIFHSDSVENTFVFVVLLFSSSFFSASHRGQNNWTQRKSSVSICWYIYLRALWVLINWAFVLMLISNFIVFEGFNDGLCAHEQLNLSFTQTDLWLSTNGSRRSSLDLEEETHFWRWI